MKITIVIEDGKVTTQHESGEVSEVDLGHGTAGRVPVIDAGAAPGAVRDEALLLAEADRLPAGLEPEHPASGAGATEGEDAGAAPSV